MTQPGNGNIGQLNNNETRAEHRAARRRPPRAETRPCRCPPRARDGRPSATRWDARFFLLSEPAAVFHTSHRFHGSDGVARFPRLAHTAFYNA